MIISNARFIGFIVADTLIVVQVLSGLISVGATIGGAAPGTTVTFDETGNGGPGAYKIYPPQTVPDATMTAILGFRAGRLLTNDHTRVRVLASQH